MIAFCQLVVNLTQGELYLINTNGDSGFTVWLNIPQQNCTINMLWSRHHNKSQSTYMQLWEYQYPPHMIMDYDHAEWPENHQAEPRAK